MILMYMEWTPRKYCRRYRAHQKQWTRLINKVIVFRVVASIGLGYAGGVRGLGGELHSMGKNSILFVR